MVTSRPKGLYGWIPLASPVIAPQSKLHSRRHCVVWILFRAFVFGIGFVVFALWFLNML